MLNTLLPSENSPAPQFNPVAWRRWPVVLLLLFTAAAIWVKWGKLDSLLWQDPAWWLNEYGRFAHGELPYRDFYWPYGPWSITVFGWPMRLFGARFAVAQAVVDVFSAAVVFFAYRIARRLIPSPLAEITVFWVVAVGITARTYFSLFSLIGYTPSVHVAGAGLLMMMDGVLGYLQDGRPRVAWISVGAILACLGKQETLAAAVLVYVMLAWFDKRSSFVSAKEWLHRYTLLAFTCFLIPVVDYLLWGQVSSWAKFLACMQAFGLSRLACPWWPNGYGLAGAAVASLEAGVIFVLGLLFAPDTRAYISRRYLIVTFFIAGTIVAVIAFEWRLFSDLLYGHGSVRQRIYREAIELLSTSSVLRPVLWAGYLYGGALVARAIRRRSITKTQFIDLLVIAVPGLMSIRSLFGTILSHELEVPAITYPFLLLLGPYLLFLGLTRFLHPTAPRRSREPYALVFCAIFILGYGTIRLVGGYSALLANATFPIIATPAGPVALRLSSQEKPILDYVLANSASTDTILELPFGGGMSFATGRMQPTYSTLFIQLEPSQAIQQEDLKRLLAHPPAIVIARQGPHLGTLYGIEENVCCNFPQFVWKSDKQCSDPNYVFPVVDYIERNYRIDKTIGPWVLLLPNADHARKADF